MIMNYTENNDVMNSSLTIQTQALVSGGSSDAKNLSLVVRVLTGLVIPILFTIGLGANVVVLYVLRRRGIPLKNTAVILANVMFTDLISVLIILPLDFVFYVLDVTLPRMKEVFKIFVAIKNALIFLNCSFTMALTIERTKTATYLGKRRGDRLSKRVVLCLVTVWISSLGEVVMTFSTLTDSVTLPWKFKAAAQATYPSFRIMSAGTIIAMVLVLAATLVILVSLYRIRSFLLGLNEDAEQTFLVFISRTCYLICTND